MIQITLPDGNIRDFEQLQVNGFEIAGSVSKALAKSAVAMRVDGQIKDLVYSITKNAKVDIVISSSDEGLGIIRHSAAHILAQAVKELYPETQVTIGPIIKDGFYYDFAHPTPFSTADLVDIERKMHEIIRRDHRFIRKVITKKEAVEYFNKLGEQYKVEIVNELKDTEEISTYDQGGFCDLCRGPHVPSARYVKAFKLTKVAGAYWRGDSSNTMLQRIYGTAWDSNEQLDAYLHRLEEAEKRDHRRIGKVMGLFHFQEEAPGTAFWHPKGWTLFQTLVSYMRRQQSAAGYLEINTPEIMDRSLWEASGHWEKFRENMFIAQVCNEERTYAVRPMNCPGGVQVFKHDVVSYRNLPLMLSEFGKVYRFEPSGALHGLLRVRGFTQDDAHVFCTEGQMLEQSQNVCNFILKIYKDFGFHDVYIKFSDRPAKRIGSDEVWDKAESALLNALKNLNLDYTFNPGEGAFYGPKLEFVLRDAIGRDWQFGTLQIDLNMPARFNATYTGEDGKKHHPVMLHRAIFGSLERFIGIMLEHYTGKLPLWLAPIQLAIVTITDHAKEYANKVHELALGKNLKVVLDDENETVNYKLRKHLTAKIPIMAIIGQKEAENSTIAIRRIDSDTQETLDLTEFISKLEVETQEPK
ncbi:threonine--tRNA ligase [Alphaproteobacteria bacterium]